MKTGNKCKRTAEDMEEDKQANASDFSIQEYDALVSNSNNYES